MQLWRIADVSRRQVEAAVDRTAHATLKQFRILEIIETSFENLCPTDLARLLACSKANVTQIVQDLSSRGWLTMIPEYSDRRAVILRLTATGRHVYQLYGERLTERTSEQLGCLDVEEKQRLATIFRKLIVAWR